MSEPTIKEMIAAQSRTIAEVRKECIAIREECKTLARQRDEAHTRHATVSKELEWHRSIVANLLDRTSTLKAVEPGPHY